MVSNAQQFTTPNKTKYISEERKSIGIGLDCLRKFQPNKRRIFGKSSWEGRKQKLVGKQKQLCHEKAQFIIISYFNEFQQCFCPSRPCFIKFVDLWMNFTFRLLFAKLWQFFNIKTDLTCWEKLLLSTNACDFLFWGKVFAAHEDDY